MKKLIPLLQILSIFFVLALLAWMNLSDFLPIPKLIIDINVFGKNIKKNFDMKYGLDLKGGSRLVFEADMKKIKKEDQIDALSSARNIIERRVNLFGVSEPSITTIESNNTKRIVVEIPGISDTTEAVNLIGRTAQLEFLELPATEEAKIATSTPLILRLTKKTGLTGKDIQKAYVQFDQNTGKPGVGLEFNTEGAKLFEKITERNVGKPVGIFLDGYPLSAPIVQQVISGGRASITGEFSLKEAKELSISINSGALPIPIRLVEQKTIGPTLGIQHIKMSVIAGTVGLGTVILFMVFFYGRLGIIATFSLLLYGLITMTIFRLIPVVLTLSGVAGFILSIGMAVDSNILIFERIKEEIRNGVSKDVAIRLGFGRAIDAIKDANITTLLVAFILFNPLNWSFFPQFGLVRGFALTLAIGVGTSLFTGVVITKRIITFLHRKNFI